MELKTAINRAAKFARAAPKEGVDPLSMLLLVPATYDESKIEFVDDVVLPVTPAYVQASDGTVTYRAYLDLDVVVPHCIVDADAVQRSASAFKKSAFFIERVGDQLAVMRGLDGTFFQMPAGHATAFPSDPAFPERLHPFAHASMVRRLLHVTKKIEKTRPELLFLHAHSGLVETSDQMRTARVPVALPAEGRLVHRDVWEHWPKRVESHVGFAVHNDVAFVSVDEELRWGPAPPDKDFFDLTAVFPSADVGYAAALPRLAFMSAVKFAITASPFDAVELIFQNEKVQVCGLGDQGSQESKYDVTALGASDLVRIIMRGRLLWDSLSAQDDEYITVRYVAPDQPLRLETPVGYVEALWPMVPTE